MVQQRVVVGRLLSVGVLADRRFRWAVHMVSGEGSEGAGERSSLSAGASAWLASATWA